MSQEESEPVFIRICREQPNKDGSFQSSPKILPPSTMGSGWKRTVLSQEEGGLILDDKV